ncbi:MAG: hypothetical protein GY835_17955 [bacterium]|nr:hypothetical protein [bacterium]
MTAFKHPVLFFEPAGIRRFGPPIDTRPVWELRVGPVTVGEVLTCRLGDEPIVGFWTREEITPVCPRPQTGFFDADSILLIAGHHLPFVDSWWDDLTRLEPGQSLEVAGEVLALHLDGPAALRYLKALDHSAEIPAPESVAIEGPYGPLIRYWWELHELAPRSLEWHIAMRGIRSEGGDDTPDSEGWMNNDDLYLHETVRIDTGVNVDTGGGPIMIDAEVAIGTGSYIKGPCYLGPRTQVKPLTQLMGGCFCGPECRLGGEIANTQFQGYANKGHHGFLGHSFVGEWVNLGAGTTNSNLKNNYSDVRVEYNGMQIDTKRSFLGCCLGDHVKVGIQGRINTGSVLSTFSNWFGTGFPPKWLPPFSWGGDDGISIHRLVDAEVTAARMFERREYDPGPELIAIYRSIFQKNEESRKEF